ncbi:ABC-2 transporter permease [Thermoanaerobacterium thermosaccharolyticum]|uniref:ABC-2 transporter permease n=1 Tax=Thermoanaerobacterium thermosaccharolyticum TaxID=1517 RepID=UPI00123AF010|nr:ABC-2 transporter permease [Thermoanaerobacterium thermosaccharolyticum]KAA5806217.1 ABC-2 transporter permease [Thermoanaerobacterium thermosaccharolyticum]
MYSLLLKDILVQKKQFLYGILLAAVYSFAFGSDNLDGVLTVFVFPYIFVLTAASYEEKNKAEMILISLPIKRSLLVMEKYVSVFLFAALGAIEYIIVVGIGNLFQLPIKFSTLTIEAVLIFGLAMYYGIYLPLYFKFGYLKTRWVNFVMFFGLFFGVPSLVSAINKYGINFKILNPLITFFKNQSNIAVANELIIMALLIYALSYAISVKIYNSREF